jgi:hypothetical protein
MAAREAVLDPTRTLEALNERTSQRRMQRLRKVEALDRHRRLDAKMVAFVDDAELPLAHERFHSKLTIQHVLEQVEGIAKFAWRAVAKPAGQEPAPTRAGDAFYQATPGNAFAGRANR